MDWMNYKQIQIMKESEKAVVMFAAVDGFESPFIVKRLFYANPDVYHMLAKQKNPHIPTIYHIEEQKDELIIFEEYVNGLMLDEYLRQNNADVITTLELMLQLCEILEILHNSQPPVIHRDIKPSNILIDVDGILKIIDFDASRFYKSEKNTSDTRLLGTIEYAAPEQFGYAQTDARSDIYSVGVMLNELEIVRNSPVGKRWKRLVGKCTGFDPEKRYDNVSYLKKDIKCCIWYAKHSAFLRMVRIVLIIMSLVTVMVVGIRTVSDKYTANDITGTLTPEPIQETNTPGIKEEDSENTNPDENGIGNTDTVERAGELFVETVFSRNAETSSELILKLRSDISGSLEAVYVCIKEAEEEFSEILIPLAEDYYTVSDDGRNLQVKPEFFTEYGETAPWVLFVELDDRRGEKVWIYSMEINQ